MTQEQKAIAYDKVREKIALRFGSNVAEEVFSEFEMSDDERIRKAIFIYLDWLDGRKDCAPRGEHSIRDMIAWLEKQGTSYTKRNVDDAYVKGMAFAKDELEKQKPAWSEEDEIGLGDALWCCKQAASIAKDENDMGNAWYAERWLKSLRPQNRWKPSEKQIMALRWIMNNIPYNSHKEEISGLLNQIKEL